MAGPIVPATGIIESRQFMFCDDDATYDLTIMRFDDGDIELSVEVTANGASKCTRADLLLSANDADVVAGALLDLVSISHIEDRRIAFVTDGVALGISVRSSGEAMGIQLRQSTGEMKPVFVPLALSYAKMIGRALQDMAQHAREGL